MKRQREFPPHYFLRICNKNRFFSKKTFYPSSFFIQKPKQRKHAGDAKKVNLLIKRNWVFLFWRSYQAGNILSLRSAFGTDVPDRPCKGTEAKTEPPSPIHQKISQNLAFFFSLTFSNGTLLYPLRLDG